MARPARPRRAIWLGLLGLCLLVATVAAGVGLLTRAGKPSRESVNPDGQAELIEGTGPPLVIHHVRDFHLVERDLFARDVGLDGAALDAAWAKHQDAVEQTQAEQLVVLRDLARRGVRAAYAEGLTAGGVEAWQAMAEVVRAQQADERRARATRDEALAAAARSADDRRKQDALKLADEAAKLAAEMRLMRLRAGALALVEELTARPLDDEKALDEAAPSGRPGELRFDPAALARRREAMGRALAAAVEPEVVVVLGAAHDLGPVLRQTGRKVRLNRVTVKKVRELVGER